MNPQLLLALFLVGATDGEGAAPPPETATPDKPKRVLVMDLKSNGVDPAVANQATALLAEPLAGQPGYTTVTMDDLRKIVSVEQTRSMLGCASDVACVADISRQAEVDLVITGSLGMVGKRVTLSAMLIDARSSTVLERSSLTMDGFRELPEKARTMIATLLGIDPDAAVRFQLPAGQGTSFAVLDLVASGVVDTVATNLTQILSSELKRVEGVSVISRDDIQALLQLEEQKSKLGCDDISCLAEIGGALGVERLVAGNVGRLGDAYVISMRLISVHQVRVDNRVTESFSGEEEQLIRAVRHTARRLLGIDPKATGAIAVTASETGATVELDGKVVGKLPLPPAKDLAPGAHAIRVSRSGFHDWRGEVYVDPQDTTAVWVRLQRKPPQWYQRPWVWVLGGGGAAVAAVLVTTILTAGVGSVLIAYRVFTYRKPETGSGTAGFEE